MSLLNIIKELIPTGITRRFVKNIPRHSNPDDPYYINEKWYNNLELTKQYIDINKKRPSNDIKFLEKWVEMQVTNSINREYIMKNDDIYKAWNEFITGEKYKKYFTSNISKL